MQHPVTQHQAAPHSAVPRLTVPHLAVPHSAAPQAAVPRHAVLRHAVPHEAAWPRAAWPRAPWRLPFRCTSFWRAADGDQSGLTPSLPATASVSLPAQHPAPTGGTPRPVNRPVRIPPLPRPPAGAPPVVERLPGRAPVPDPAQLPLRAAGFSLIELLIVMGIIGILSAVLLPNLMGARTIAQDRAAQAYSGQVYTAVLAYLAEDPSNAVDDISSGCGAGAEFVAGSFSVGDPGGVVAADGCSVDEEDGVPTVTVTSVNGKGFVNGRSAD